MVSILVVSNNELDADFVWDFENTDNNKVFVAEKPANNDSAYNIDRTRNFGELLQGTTLEWDGVLRSKVAYFSGNNSGVLFQNLTVPCLSDVNMSTCTNGFSISFWIKWIKGGAESFVISSSLISIIEFAANGGPIEVYDEKTNLYYKIIDSLFTNEWQFFTITWSQSNGLMVFINGTQFEFERVGIPVGIVQGRDSFENNWLGIGRIASKKFSPDNAVFYFNKLMFWRRVLTADEVGKIYTKGRICIL